MSHDTSDTYDPTEKWIDDRNESTGGLGEIGVDVEEGGRESEAFAQAQREGYLRTSDQDAVKHERQGLGQFGARHGDTKGLEEFEGERSAREMLMEIEGIGPKRADALLEAFGDGRSVAKRAANNWGAVAKVDGISQNTAQQLFHRMREAGVYDDLRSFSRDDAASISHQGPTSRKPVPNEEVGDVYDPVTDQVIDKRELPDEAVSASDLELDPEYQGTPAAIVEKESEREEFEQAMSGIYDPTEDDDPSVTKIQEGTDAVNDSSEPPADFDAIDPEAHYPEPGESINGWTVVDDDHTARLEATVGSDRRVEIFSQAERRDEWSVGVQAYYEYEDGYDGPGESVVGRYSLEDPNGEIALTKIPSWESARKLSILEAVETDPQEAWSEAVDDPIAIEFGRLEAANEARSGRGHQLHPDDNRASKTVKLRGTLSEHDIEWFEEEALKSRSDETKTYGQAKLTDDERKQLQQRDDWNWQDNGFESMSAKAALTQEGATDWMNYYEAGMDQGAALSQFEEGKIAESQGAGSATTRRMDNDPDLSEVARQAQRVEGEQCSAAEQSAETGDLEALEFLVEHCGWSEDEVQELTDAFDTIDEDAGVVLSGIYDPTAETEDTGTSFEEWARQAAPEPPAEPDDEELARIAPTPASGDDDELPPEAYRALKKAWSGYKLARGEQREAVARADHFASIINGIRVVNGQDPLEFEGLEGFEGGRPLPADEDESFPTNQGEMSLDEAEEKGRLSSAVQTGLNRYVGDCYDPCEELP